MKYEGNNDVWLAVVKQGVAAGTLSVARLSIEVMQASFGSYGRFRSSPAGMPPNQRRSMLSRSFQARNMQTINAEVWSQVPYARTHELGGVITAKNVKFLPVPINDAAQRLHETKGTQSLRSFNMRLFKLPSGRMYLRGEDKVRTQRYEGTNKKEVVDQSRPVFRLMRSVKIPKRPYIQPAINNIAKERAIRYFVASFVARVGNIMGVGS